MSKKVVSFKKQMEVAASQYNQIQKLEAQIQEQRAYIQEWSYFPDERTYIRSHRRSHNAKSIITLLFQIMLACIVGCIIFCHIAAGIMEMHVDVFGGLMFGIIFGVMITPAVFILFTVIRYFLRKRSLMRKYNLEYDDYYKHHVLIGSVEKQIDNLQSEIDAIVRKANIPSRYLPYANIFLKYANQERADNIKEALECFSNDVEFERERKVYLDMLLKAKDKLSDAKQQHQEAVALRSEMELFSENARNLEFMEEIRFMSKK